jgi:hypothetical protein
VGRPRSLANSQATVSLVHILGKSTPPPECNSLGHVRIHVFRCERWCWSCLAFQSVYSELCKEINNTPIYFGSCMTFICGFVSRFGKLKGIGLILETYVPNLFFS